MGLRDFELTSDYVLDPTEKTELIERLKKQNKLDELRNIAFFSSPKTADGMRYILFHIIVFYRMVCPNSIHLFLFLQN